MGNIDKHRQHCFWSDHQSFYSGDFIPKQENIQHCENFYLAQDVDVKNIPTLKESPLPGKKKPRKQLPQQQPPMESSAQNSSMPTSANTTPTSVEFPISTSGHLQINSKDDHKRRMKQILGSEADSEMLDAYSENDGMLGSGHHPQSSAKPVHDAPQAVTSTSFGISGVDHSLDFATIHAHGTTNPVPPPQRKCGTKMSRTKRSTEQRRTKPPKQKRREICGND